MQSASAVRSQRSTIVQTARQGETVRAQTEVIANYNHCHALTIEYFEVLRHLQVSQEIAHVQECLFIPLRITQFTPDKTLAWRRPLEGALRARRYLPYFKALERVVTDWQQADFPDGSYAEDRVIHSRDRRTPAAMTTIRTPGNPIDRCWVWSRTMRRKRKSCGSDTWESHCPLSARKFGTLVWLQVSHNGSSNC